MKNASRTALRASKADDGDFLVALYQQLTGRTPTAKEIGNARKRLDRTATLPPSRPTRDPSESE